MQLKRNQQGVALITAILIVAIATILAAKLTWDNQVNIRRTEATLAQEQARLLAISAEAITIQLLIDNDNNLDHDHAQAGWLVNNESLLPIDIDGVVIGQMGGQLCDAQGKLNINNLQPIPAGNPGDLSQPIPPDPIAVEIFENLFSELGLDLRLVHNLIDWIDPDTIPYRQGVEDSSYTALDPGYRVANDYITSISELRAIEGFDDDVIAVLEPHITAIRPDWCGAVGGKTPVNVNFATAAVLSAIPDGGSAPQAQAWADELSNAGWETLSQVPQELTDRSNYITLKSECLRLNVTVNIGDSLLTMYSLLDRASSNKAIVSRVRAFGLDNEACLKP